MTIYQLLPRLFRKGKFSSIDKRALSYLKDLGASHIWLTGVIRHSMGKDYVKGDIGSPYSIADYYDVNPYLATNEDNRLAEFKRALKRTHDNGLKLLLDFVPNHVSPDYHDEHGGIKTLGIHDYDWTDTEKIDYSDKSNWTKMLDILSHWAVMGVDGFRCDMVELVPLDFWHYIIAECKKRFPALIFVAEVYNKDAYGNFVDAGFDALYDKSGLYDTIRAVVAGHAPASQITSNWQSLGGLQPKMLNFLENHDEQRLASPCFAGSPQAGYAALAVSVLFYPCPFMLYFGQEIGEDAHDGANGRTSIFSEQRHIDPIGKLSDNETMIQNRYREILCLKEALGDAVNYDLCYAQSPENGFDANRHFAFMRYDDNHCVLVVSNFSKDEARMVISIPEGAPQAFGQSVEVEVAAQDFVILSK